MRRSRRRALTLAVLAGIVAIAALAGTLGAGLAGDGPGYVPFKSKFAGGDPDAVRQRGSAPATPGEGPVGGWEAFRAAERTYPADTISPQIVAKARATFAKIAQAGSSQGNNHWEPYAPLSIAQQPGVLAFSGATNTTASRVTAMVIAPTCTPGNCRLWVGVSGGGVWRTDDALAAGPELDVPHSRHRAELGRHADGRLRAIRPATRSTSAPARRTGAAPAARPVSASTSRRTAGRAGRSWRTACTSNSTYACVTPGQDAFLGRSISKIVVDPANPNHLYVGSALGVRGLSHVIGNGGTTRFPPGANDVGLYESTDGGATFTEVWNGNGSTFGVIDVGLDPLDAVDRLRLGVRPGPLAALGRARRLVHAVRLPPGVRAPLPRWRDRPDDVRRDGEERRRRAST